VWLAEINAILFHKLCGDVLFDEIDQDIKEDKYDYPVILPFRLREVVRRKEALLKKDEDAARARHPGRSEVVHDRALYEKESLIQALVLKRPPAVITQKKDTEKWAEQGVSHSCFFAVFRCFRGPAAICFEEAGCVQWHRNVKVPRRRRLDSQKDEEKQQSRSKAHVRFDKQLD
jgi:hypothetical protein